MLEMKLFALISVVVFSIFARASDVSIDLSLARKIESLQVQSDEVRKGFDWEKRAGLFESWVHINFDGRLKNDSLSASAAALQDHIEIFDNNFFVTAWTLDSLLEIEELENASVDTSLIQKSLDAELQFVDKNHPDADLVSFWPQVKKDKHWVADATNLAAILKEFLPHSAIRDSLQIPSDLDDTSVNWMLGSKLGRVGASEAFSKWQNQNDTKKIANSLRLILNYAYQPSSSITDQKYLDPRSYFITRPFLEGHANAPLVLGMTWMTNLSEERSQDLKHLDVAMPFNVNNVDASVLANFIYALASLESNPATSLREVFKNDRNLEASVAKLVEDSANYLAWVVDQELAVKRPDLVSLYYPARYNLYWFIARTLTLTQKYDLPNFKSVGEIFENSLRNQGTRTLLREAKGVTWSDILAHEDDQLYSTAVVLNALLDIWTKPAGKSYRWIESTPPQVRSRVWQSLKWLSLNILNPKNGVENVFFAPSVKGSSSLAPYYPANLHELLMGESFDPHLKKLRDGSDAVNAMFGIVSPATYVEIEKKDQDSFLPKNFRPEKFSGLNSGFPFPYWSAPVLTYTFARRALVKGARLTE